MSLEAQATYHRQNVEEFSAVEVQQRSQIRVRQLVVRMQFGVETRDARKYLQNREA